MRLLSSAALLLLGSAAVLAQDPPAPPSGPAGLSGRKLVDHHVRAKWSEKELSPSSRSEDAEFLRRVSLDLVGSIPSLEDAKAFLESGASDKREKLVDSLLASEKYAEHWATTWAGSLVGHEDDNQVASARLVMNRALRPLLEKNLPYDEFVRQVIAAKGVMPDPRGLARGMMGGKKKDEAAEPDPEENLLTAFYVRLQRQAQRELPQAVAGKLTRVFLGTQIQCAQCHDHPFDAWTQEDFYGMAAFFSQLSVRRKNMGDEKDYTFTVDDRPVRGRFGGGLVIPDSKKGPIKPSFLWSKAGPEPKEEPRAAYARLLTSPETAQFAKAAVNRYWGHLFGRGLVNPIDGFDSRNAPSHPELLAELARDFVAHGHDVKWLLKELALSDTYQLSSRARAKAPQAEKYYAVAAVRGLTPEQIMNSLVTAATTGGDPGSVMRGRDLLQAFRDFRYAFGDDEGSEILEFQGTIPGALVMMNSPAIQRATIATARGGGGRLQSIVSTHKNPSDQVRAMFLAVLTRPPTSSELSRFSAVCAKGPSGAEDAFWVLLNSSEFLFNK